MRSNCLRAVPHGAVLAVLCLVVLSVASGCGGDVRPVGSPLTFSTTTVGSQEFGFLLKYPADYVKIEPDVGQSGNPGLLHQVYLADPNGATSGETALDVVGLAVYRLNRAAGPKDLSRHEGEFQAMATKLIKRPTGLRIVEPFRVTELADHQALKGLYAYRVGDADIAVVAYLVPVGERVYWVTGQASRTTWDTAGRVIGSTIATLRLTESE